ncbi:hypothetical protein DER46DRAFT_686250 [Fusarium sp. MPI-SDFR-AT-0072]|nr:hypothetical protein DER46DRAFT_686250 [Fusarium sp. MPI-SDFR-AT-0072]
MAGSTSRSTVDVNQLVSRDRSLAALVSTSRTTIDQLLLTDEPEPPFPRGSDKLCHAVEMIERYAYDDSASHIPQNLRGATPNQLKTDGKLRLYAKEQGFILSINPKSTHGMVLFMKGHIQIFAIVPTTLLRQGSAFRTLADKTADNIPLLEAPAMGLQPQQANNLFDRTVRTLWNLVSRPYSIPKLQELLMPEEDIAGYFSTARDNVDSITNALLPQDTSQADINRNVGMYIGQSRRIRDRMGEYRRNMVPETRDPHLRIALKSSPEDRHMIPIMIWEDGDVSSRILNMAEQTMILLLRSYQPFLFVSENDLYPVTVVNSRRAKLLASFQQKAASTTGWPRINCRGLNQESPIYGNTRSIYQFLSIPMTPGNPNARSFTSHRIRRTLYYLTGVAGVRWGFNNHYSDTNTKKKFLSFRVMNETLNAQRPKYGYLVFEIMDDDKLHPRPYMGFNESAQRWCKAIVAKIQYIDPVKLARTGDAEACLKPYRDGMMIFQALKGIDYTGPLDGFSRRVTILCQNMSVLKTNHLLQEYRLEPQRRVSSWQTADLRYLYPCFFWWPCPLVLCSLFNRPCTFTALSQLPHLFGNRPPSRHPNYSLSVYPDGPFRWLIYRRDSSNEELNANDPVPEPFEERFGPIEEDEEAEVAERDEAQGQVLELDEE